MNSRWHISGECVVACNCDYGCPCNFGARPTMGFCESALGFRIDEGAYGDVRLDGQQAVIALKWPGPIYEGNGVAAVFIDEAASRAQREALTTIIWGKAGGAPWAVLAPTWTRILGPDYVPIAMKIAGRDTDVAVGDRIKFSFQPIRHPLTKAEANPRVVLPEGFLFKEGEQYALNEFWVKASPELSFAHPGKCGELMRVRWQGP